jgi:hypothetical protein
MVATHSHNARRDGALSTSRLFHDWQRKVSGTGLEWVGWMWLVLREMELPRIMVFCVWVQRMEIMLDRASAEQGEWNTFLRMQISSVRVVVARTVETMGGLLATGNTVLELN